MNLHKRIRPGLALLVLLNLVPLAGVLVWGLSAPELVNNVVYANSGVGVYAQFDMLSVSYGDVFGNDVTRCVDDGIEMAPGSDPVHDAPRLSRLDRDRLTGEQHLHRLCVGDLAAQANVPAAWRAPQARARPAGG